MNESVRTMTGDEAKRKIASIKGYTFLRMRALKDGSGEVLCGTKPGSLSESIITDEDDPAAFLTLHYKQKVIIDG